jgi:hypothetical protein
MRIVHARGAHGVLRDAFNFLGMVVGLNNNFSSWWFELWERLHMLVYVALAYFYPVLLRVSLGSFFCIGLEGQQFWSVDMSLTCWTGRHLPWVMTVGFDGVLVLVFVVPVFYNFTQLDRHVHAADADTIISNLEEGKGREPGSRHAVPCERERARAPHGVLANEGPPSGSRARGQSPNPLAQCVRGLVDAEGQLTGLGRLQLYLHGSYRKGCRAWEGYLQICMVGIVLISVASPSWGPYYTLLAYCGLLAACMLDHGISKPYKDLALQQLQTFAYIVLLINVGLGIIVVTANTRPGPRSLGSHVFRQSVAAATEEHCPEQLFGESNSSKTVAAASFAMVVVNVCFVALLA